MKYDKYLNVVVVVVAAWKKIHKTEVAGKYKMWMKERKKKTYNMQGRAEYE